MPFKQRFGTPLATTCGGRAADRYCFVRQLRRDKTVSYFAGDCTGLTRYIKIPAISLFGSLVLLLHAKRRLVCRLYRIWVRWTTLRRVPVGWRVHRRLFDIWGWASGLKLPKAFKVKRCQAGEPAGSRVCPLKKCRNTQARRLDARLVLSRDLPTFEMFSAGRYYKFQLGRFPA